MAALILASLGFGCGLFDIREPSAPSAGEGPPRANPVDPDSVLFNLTWAIRYQGRGEGQYEESLGDGYHLVLDPTDRIDIGVDSLSKSRDLLAHRELSAASADSFHFTFGSMPWVDAGNIAYYLDIPYDLFVLDPSGDTTQSIRGKADLYLTFTQAGKWVMTRWVDKRIDPFTSYGRWHGDQVGPE